MVAAYVALVVIGVIVVVAAAAGVRWMLVRSDPRIGWGTTAIATLMVTSTFLLGLVWFALFVVAR